MQRVTSMELARRLCEADHPRVPPVRSPGGTPCARHIRQATEQWYLTQESGQADLDVLVEAAEEDVRPALPAAITEAWGIIANALATMGEEGDLQQAANAWRAKWMPAAVPAEGSLHE